MIHVFKSVEKDSIIPHQRRFLTKRFDCGLCSQQALEFMREWQMGEARRKKKICGLQDTKLPVEHSASKA